MSKQEEKLTQRDSDDVRSPGRRWLQFSLLALLLAAMFPGQAQAVIGGDKVTTPTSWIVSVQQPDGSHVCTASLIDSRWALMAFHCTLAGSDLQVRVGSLDRTQGGEVVPVAETHKHPLAEFDPDAGTVSGTDLALVKLDRPVSAAPIELASEAPKNGSPMRAMGWGYTCFTGCELPSRLQEMTFAVDTESCDTADNQVLCLHDKEQGASAGDSGGPALTKTGEEWRLAGVTNGGGKNSETGEYRSVYTELSPHLDWISKTTGRELRAIA